MRSVADLLPGGEETPAASEGDPNDPNAAHAGTPAELLASPVTPDELAYLMDRLSIRQPQQQREPIPGLININAAPARVLMTIPGMTGEYAAAIVAGRKEVDAALLSTPAWPVITETLEPGAFKMIAPYITTKAYQFHVEVLGYARPPENCKTPGMDHRNGRPSGPDQVSSRPDASGFGLAGWT